MFTVVSKNVDSSNKFKLKSRNYEIKLDFSEKDFIEANKYMDKFMENLLTELTKNVVKKDKIFIVFMHPSLDWPISLPFLKVEDLKPEIFSGIFERVAQSQHSLRIDENLFIRSIISHIPNGNGEDVITNFLKRKKGIIRIESNQFCAIRAIIIGKRILEKQSFHNLNRKNNKYMNKLVQDFLEDFQVTNKTGNLNIKEIIDIEKKLKGYSIAIYDITSKITKKPIYKGIGGPRTINLFLYNKHYSLIRSIEAFFSNFFLIFFLTFKQIEKKNCLFI